MTLSVFVLPLPTLLLMPVSVPVPTPRMPGCCSVVVTAAVLVEEDDTSVLLGLRGGGRGTSGPKAKFEVAVESTGAALEVLTGVSEGSILRGDHNASSPELVAEDCLTDPAAAAA